MKLHRLTIRGLRSFTGETSIDLERLGEQGLFAIVGPIGVGKSTALLKLIVPKIYGEIRREAGPPPSSH